jgi:hypothetical protein
MPGLKPTIAYHRRPTPHALPQLRQVPCAVTKLVGFLDQSTGKAVAFRVTGCTAVFLRDAYLHGAVQLQSSSPANAA